MKKLKIYECLIEDKDETGVYAVSFVDDPAIESNFIALSKTEPVKLAINKQKQILTGAVLIPEKLIYRNDDFDPEGYYIKFPASEIEKIRDKMMLKGIALQSTTHQHLSPLKGNYLVEVWTVEDPKTDKSVALGLGELPQGTLLASYKITSATYWRKEVLSGKVRGFSIEGLFNFNNINMTKVTKKAPSAKPKAGLFKDIPAFFRTVAAFMETETVAEAESLVDEAEKDEVDAGTPYVIFPLNEGGEIWVDAEGNATLNGNEAVTAGEYPLSDGNVVIIDENGKLVKSTDETTATDPETPEVTMARQRGKQFFKKPVAKDNAKKIAELEAQIAELKKTPSAPKARPNTGKNVIEVIEMNADTPYHKRAASVIAERRQRNGL